MMEVTILNPDVLRDLYKNHGQFACTCYDTPEKYAERVGKACQKDGHMSGSRCEYIKFRITGVDRGTAEQALRHEIGNRVSPDMLDNYTITELMGVLDDVNPSSIVKNMASFRYIDKDGFKWATPSMIANDPEACEYYDLIMGEINRYRKTLNDILVRKGHDPKAVTEAVNYILPRATTTEFVIGMTPEALIRFCHKRLCNRAQEHIHKMALQMRQAVGEINPEFARELVSHCDYLLWCPEGKRCCGRNPTKEELLNRLKGRKFDINVDHDTMYAAAEMANSALDRVVKSLDSYRPKDEV